MWAVIFALFLEGLNGSYIYFFELKMDLSQVEALTEHSAAIHMNAVFILALASWLYKGGSPAKRILILLMSPPIFLTYLAAQRRAAFVTILVVLVFMTVLLFRERRIAFWLIIPPTMILGVVYLVAFWNSSGALGLPAQAVKSVIAQDQANAKDQSSNIYRQIENVNSSYTIHQAPLTGVGFGQKLIFIVPLPDISFFIWWEYITHNSIIWIWAKTGIGGFVSMLVLIGLSVILGMRTTERMPNGNLRAVAFTATAYIIMHFIYAYVDISWDNQSMVLAGLMMGIISGMERVVVLDSPQTPKRYIWQKPAPLEPGLRPLLGETPA